MDNFIACFCYIFSKLTINWWFCSVIFASQLHIKQTVQRQNYLTYKDTLISQYHIYKSYTCYIFSKLPINWWFCLQRYIDTSPSYLQIISNIQIDTFKFLIQISHDKQKIILNVKDSIGLMIWQSCIINKLLLTDLWRLPKSSAQYLALSSDLLSLPVEAERTLAPVLTHIFDGFVIWEVSNLGGHGGFLETLSTSKIYLSYRKSRTIRQSHTSVTIIFCRYIKR